MSGSHRSAPQTTSNKARIGDSALAKRLERELEGEVLFDAFSRGRYSTDASIYQIEPIGVVVPRSDRDVKTAIAIAAEEGIPVLPRGAGTSQCGQTVGEALVVDTSKHMNGIVALDTGARRVSVQPGIVLDQLNAQLRRHGLFFPVDVSPANRATIGGMTGNNSCGARSIRYGNMIHNVAAIDGVLADGSEIHFDRVPGNLDGVEGNARYSDLVQAMRRLAADNADEIDKRIPKILRRVGGYNIDSIDAAGHNMAHLLVGSEGTLGFFSQIHLDLQAIPARRVLGVCHFGRFYDAMAATQHIVELDPTAVELVDRTLLDLAEQNPAFAPIIAAVVEGRPEAILLVEFAGEDDRTLLAKLRQLEELTAGLGEHTVPVTDAAQQRAVWDVRKAALNIAMSMKGDGKPVSFIEDCAVPLADLADYTDRLNGVFARHGTRGTWYAHASVGCLHVRPILNMKDQGDVAKMRAIAEEAFAMVREYKGSHSGEHGDGLVRSEHHEAMFGSEIVRAFETVKDTFDPDGLFNPGKIVRPPKMDDRSLFRYPPDYAPEPIETVLDWSVWGGFAGAIEMCNNNGTCRKASPGVMCPSFRVTGDEKHVTRGRANSLRLAITGQLGRDALMSDAMKETMDLCVGCKGCRRECPTGVDMAKMKIEYLAQYRKRHPLSRRERLVAYLPRYAPMAARAGGLLNLRDGLPGAAALSEAFTGMSSRRSLPRWQRPYRAPSASGNGDPVVLLADTFTTYFEPENARAAHKVLSGAGFRVETAQADDSSRPLCCGRTFLAAGLVEEARREAERTLRALTPYVERGVPIVGLEPSCLLTLRDEFPAVLPGAATEALAKQAMLFEQFLSQHRNRLQPKPTRWRRALVHGHCHQKAFGLMGDVTDILQTVPDWTVETVESSCCGMAGAFGYEAEHYDVSMKMAELSLLPAVREADADTVIVADGTSCRHQIKDGAGREALHVARVLAEACG